MWAEPFWPEKGHNGRPQSLQRTTELAASAANADESDKPSTRWRGREGGTKRAGGNDAAEERESERASEREVCSAPTVKEGRVKDGTDTASYVDVGCVMYYYRT